MNTKLFGSLIGKNSLRCSAQKQTGIARTTVTGIYDSARTKLADALIHGKMLMIQGGDYTLCSGDKENCSRRCCKKEKEKER